MSNMKMNIAMQFVMARAAAEAFTQKVKTVSIEHVLCGLLKLAELRAESIAPTSTHKEQVDEDIANCKEWFAAYAINTRRTRAKLRRILLAESSSADAAASLTALMTKAEKLVKDDNKSVVTAFAVLRTIFDYPTPMVKAVCHIGDTPKTEGIPTEKQQPKMDPDRNRDFLHDLTDRIHTMRLTLLDKVMGQDHVIHAFSEGLFSAEVLAASDDKRVRPKTIFVFAGPPGVGKTFLAEQAAKALAIPFKRFDMSGYSDHQQHINLVGFAPSYKDAKAGVLTGFVKENPRSILLFDEIEKAHINTIHLFLQILDAGRLHDDFTDDDVSFKDTMIIFTTNAGRQLYEGDGAKNAAGLPRATILNALETDTHPQTGKPFFPAAICSRIATGWPLIFNHLQAHNLEAISLKEFNRCCDLFYRQYGIQVSADHLLAPTLLFSQGGHVDARTLSAQSELFFKNEIFKLCRLWGSSFNDMIHSLKEIRFSVELTHLNDAVNALYINQQKPRVLIFASDAYAQRCKTMLADYSVYTAQTPEDAYTLAGKHDFDLILLDIAQDITDTDATVASLDAEIPPQGTMAAFAHIPIAASSIQTARTLFKGMRERFPDLPIYLLETEKLNLDDNLVYAFIHAGARGKIVLPVNESGVFEEEITDICNKLYLEQAAASLAAQHKTLNFETAPIASDDKQSVTIRLRDLSLKRALMAGDTNDVLDDVVKPDERFDDVIGASEAKQELNFFIDFLKNPKKFAAQNLKPPKGVLLHGPPGTGKTMLARAMAGESDVAFIAASASSFVTKYQGSGPESIRALFSKARRYAPAIIFIDEIDAIGRKRGGANAAHGEEMALNALLTEMDGFTVDSKRPVFILAATNFDIEDGRGGMGSIDAALSRRFDRKILVDLPNKADRKRYLTRKLKKYPSHHVTEKMIDRLAGRSTGLSLANLESVIESASRSAVKKNIQLNDDILEEAFEVSKYGESKDWGHSYLERVARHEAGHAFICFKQGRTPAYLTIVARGTHGGYMEHADEENAPLKTKDELLGRIRTALGGKAAELVYYGAREGISSGASGDLQSATHIARTMICSYGMDDQIGLATLSASEAEKGPLAEKITSRINDILSAELEKAIQTISTNKDRMDNLVSELLAKNKLTRDEIKAVLK